ncbi:MAG: hypothetical protein H7Y38_16280 [Armatimonadetes bacterium]|nr:hypothetical protein [Armatimonadota bacterium]
MRRIPSPALLMSLFALLAVAAPQTRAQEPTPAPSPAPPTTPKPAEVPDPLTDLERASELKDKPEFQPSAIKPSKPLFNPEKEALFTVPSNYRKPGRLKIGVFFPQDGDLRDATTSTYIALGGSLDLPARGTTRPFTPELFLDAAFDAPQDGNKASLIAGGVGFRLYPGGKIGDRARALNNPRFFVGAGVGAYFLNYEINNVKNDGVKIGGKAFLGFDFVEDWSIEASYTAVGELDNVSFGGASVLLGYRF